MLAEVLAYDYIVIENSARAAIARLNTDVLVLASAIHSIACHSFRKTF